MRIGKHVVTHSDLMELDINTLLEGEKVDMMYSDPPWGTGNLKYWQTMNKKMNDVERNDVDLHDFLNRIMSIARDGYGLERIRYLFDEFENVIVGFSGGKDSTVTFNLALMVAKEKKRLPLKVMFLDQEAEWEHTIKYVKEIMYMEEVEPLWLQVPIRLFNATSHTEHWLECWEEKASDMWIREKDPISIKENTYGTTTFGAFFGAFVNVTYPNIKTCYLSGVRAEESPTRSMALTYASTYKHITYGKILSKKLEHYTFYPLYDWSYTDIWKAIHDNDWSYCKIYDYMYQYGIPIPQMRVSNVHHETAVNSLFYLQEVEPENWNKIVKRIDGINTAGQLKKEQFFIPKDLPYMFDSWLEYRNYLLDKLVSNDEQKELFLKKFVKLDAIYIHQLVKQKMIKECINALLSNDYHMTKIGNFERRPEPNEYKKWVTGKKKELHHKGNRFITDALNNPL